MQRGSHMIIDPVIRMSMQGRGLVYSGKVSNQLMLSHLFGGWELKPYGVSNVSYISRSEIDIDKKYIVIATDGIWDEFNENEIIYKFIQLL